MSVVLQVRNLPDEVHKTLKRRAAAKGISLSEYVRSMLSAAASRPTPEELEEIIRARGRVKLAPGEIADVVRHVREHGE